MIKILVCGDYCPQNRVQSLIEKENYAAIFNEVRRYTEMVDYSIINLEAPVLNNKATPISKCGPNLKCSEKGVKALKYAGFNMVTLANNHFYDYGDKGVIDTLDTCKKYDIDIVGGGLNINDASRNVYKNIKGTIFAFINCCEHEFSIATNSSAGSSPLNPVKQFYSIQEAKKNADKVIVIVHGGHELYQLPSPRMKETYRFFIDSGADVVINHHQHCYSGYEVYHGKPIFYGLGNFCFDKKNRKNSIWNEGYMVLLYFNRNMCQYELVPYIQGNERPGIEILEDRSKFTSSISKLNLIINNDDDFEKRYISYLKESQQSISCFLEPVSNRWIKGLQRRGLLPRFVGRKCLPFMANAIMCESHRDKLEYFLSENLK